MKDLSSIPEGWQRKRISEYATVKRGASPRPIQDPKWWGGDIGWVRISDVTASRKYLTKTRDYLSDAGVSHSIKITPGDVILSICATIGRPIITTIPVCIHDGFVWFDGLSEDIDREYFYYFLASNEEDLANKRQTGTQGNLNTSIVSNFDLLVPESKAEQAKIAEVLSAVDQAIEQTEAMIAKQQRIKNGLMQDLLTRGIAEHGNLRSEETHEFKDSPLGRIPVEWEVYKLSYLIIDHQAGVYKKRELYGEGFNIVGVSDLYRHSSISGQIFRRVPLTKYEQKRYTLRADDLIYGESSLVLDGIAKMLWVTAEGEGTAFAWHTRRLCIKKEIVDSQYLYFVMGSYPVRRRIMSVATQTALTGITTTDLFSVPVPIPQKQEQEATAEHLNQIDKVIAQERTKHKKLLKLKIALMQDLLTGKVRVTELLKQKTSTEESIAK